MMQLRADHLTAFGDIILTGERPGPALCRLRRGGGLAARDDRQRQPHDENGSL